MSLPWEGALAQASATTTFVDKLARTPLSVILIFAAVCTFVRFAVFPVIRNTPVHRRTGGFGFAKFLNEAGDALVYAAILVFFLVRPFAIQTFTIPTGSMIDTLNIGSNIVANKWVYRTTDPKAGEIVVFSPPVEGRIPPESETDYIKRCIGVPGDLIEIKDEKLYRNGVAVDEPYETRTSGMDMKVLPKEQWETTVIPDFKLIEHNGKVIPVQKYGTMINNGPMTAPAYQSQSRADAEAMWASPAVEIPAGYYLMMGDNRNGSYDGRSWGLVPRDSIVGKCEFVWWPFSAIGKPQ
ncbi:MAG: signal peptidase I [Fimbriimonadaceae bacterium]|nr:signal peptidase I [Fimbriimonadaceae bacterium]